MASVGQTSIARCAAAASASFSGCLKKYTAVSSLFVFRRLGASSRQVRHIVQVMSTYHAPGTFKGCLLALSSINSLLLGFFGRSNSFLGSARVSPARTSLELLRRLSCRFKESPFWRGRRNRHARRVSLPRNLARQLFPFWWIATFQGNVGR